MFVFWPDGTSEPLRRNPAGPDDAWLLSHRGGESPIGLVLNGGAHVDAGKVPVETPQIPIPLGEGRVYLQLHLHQTFLGGLLDGLGFDQYASVMIEANLEPVEDPRKAF